MNPGGAEARRRGDLMATDKVVPVEQNRPLNKALWKHTGHTLKQQMACPEPSGFTLLEVLIAIVILTVGILGAASMQLSAIRGNGMANRMTEASIVASERAEILLNMNFGSASLKDDTATEDGYTVSWDVDTTGADTRDITVTVSWQADGENRSFDYRFLKIRNM